MRTSWIAASTLVVSALLLSRSAAAQPATRSTEGKALFEAYCAPCHGDDARGKGPIAAQLKTPPADLSRLSATHGGSYPRALVEQFVTDGSGRLAPRHAVDVMPKWGPTLNSFDPSPSRVKANIAAIVSYIETLQIRSGKQARE